MLSNMTPIVERLLGTTHVKAYASGRVDGALGEDGLDGERCVVVNRIPQLRLREAALARPLRPRLPVRRRGRPARAGEIPLLGHGGAPMAGGSSILFE